MLNHEFVLTFWSPAEPADGPRRVRTGSQKAIRELTSLGLTQETSLGILRVLVRRGVGPSGIDPSES